MISTAYHLGEKPVSPFVDKRSIIFNLCRRDIKRDILNACKELKPKLHVNESLTPTRSTLTTEVNILF